MISIIVPVYNCGEYLNKCVQSVLAQTMPDFELILVDDGSFDGSGEICDLWAESDSRVKVIHQANAGASAARNAGLDTAKGEFVAFVDADDTVSPNMAEQVVDAALLHKAEMVLFDPVVHWKGETRVMVDSIQFYDESVLLKKEEISPERLRFMAGTVWRFLFRRDLIERNGLRFDTSLPLSEDRLFNIMALGCCESVYYLRKPLYHYWINPGSAISRYRKDMLEIVLNTQNKMEAALKKYWTEEYVALYERVNLVDGALLCVYNAFSPKNTQRLRQKYAQVKRVVHDPQICAAYSRVKVKGLRQWLVRRKWALALCAVAAAWNLKNR